MNPRKAQLLRLLDETAQVHDTSIRRSVNIAAHPGTHGWQTSLLTAAVVVPLTGVSAVLTDLSRMLIARSDDAAWERSLPPSVHERDSGGPD
jgi:hypothetical protein